MSQKAFLAVRQSHLLFQGHRTRDGGKHFPGASAVLIAVREWTFRASVCSLQERTPPPATPTPSHKDSTAESHTSKAGSKFEMRPRNLLLSTWVGCNDLTLLREWSVTTLSEMFVFQDSCFSISWTQPPLLLSNWTIMSLFLRGKERVVWWDSLRQGKIGSPMWSLRKWFSRPIVTLQAFRLDTDFRTWSPQAKNVWTISSNTLGIHTTGTGGKSSSEAGEIHGCECEHRARSPLCLKSGFLPGPDLRSFRYFVTFGHIKPQAWVLDH